MPLAPRLQLCIASLAVAAFVPLLYVGAAEGQSTSTSPGKASVFVSVSREGPSPNFETVCSEIPVAGTISKGRKHSVLRLDASLRDFNFSGCTPPWGQNLLASVNGVPFNGLWIGNSTTCNGGTCSVTITNWLDIDAAEATSPGMFVGKPLNISVVPSYTLTSCGCTMAESLTFSAQQVKK